METWIKKDMKMLMDKQTWQGKGRIKWLDGNINLKIRKDAPNSMEQEKKNKNNS